jgi:hypothetical protein
MDPPTPSPPRDTLPDMKIAALAGIVPGVWFSAPTLVMAALSAQTMVPAGADLQSFINTASPGDVLQLAPSGTYDNFTLDRGLTILGPASIRATQPTNSTAIAPPAGQYARLVDLTFLGGTSAGPNARIETNGSATFERCVIGGNRFQPAAVRIPTGGQIVFDTCQIDAALATPALLVEAGADVQVVSSTIRGGGGLFTKIVNLAPQTAIQSTGSVVVSHSDVVGGNAISIFGPAGIPAPAIVSSGVGQVWITDSNVVGGSGIAGAPALSGATFRHTRSTIQGGLNQISMTPAAPVQGTAIADPALLGASETPTAILGQPWAVTVTASQPGVPIIVFLGVDPTRSFVCPRCSRSRSGTRGTR